MTERPYVSFAEVKEKIPVPDVLDALEIADRFQRKNDLLTGVCPLPAHKHGPNPNAEQFKINRKDGVWLWHCFGDCQKGGDVIELVKEMTGYDDAHVRFWFAEKFGDRLTLSRPKESQKTEKSVESLAPEFFAVHEANRLVKKGMPFRDAYSYVKEHLSELKVEDPVKAIKEVVSLGGPGNLQLNKYKIDKPL